MLYKEEPTWLHHAHAELVRAVLDAYGWPHGIGEDEQTLASTASRSAS
jgi:hypothetical protein